MVVKLGFSNSRKDLRVAENRVRGRGELLTKKEGTKEFEGIR
jgi:hypothetical protein